MLDITNSLKTIENYEKVSVTEFLHGHRFTIRVSQEAIDYTEDLEYNRRYKRQVGIQEFMNGLSRVYHVDAFRLRSTGIRDFWLHCILVDKDLTDELGPLYNFRKIFIVELVTKDKQMLAQGNLKERCKTLNIPVLEPMFIGAPSALRDKILGMRIQSNLTSNSLSGGLVIKPEPNRLVDDHFTRLYVKPDYSRSTIIDGMAPQAAARELVWVVLTPQEILNLEKMSNLDPVGNPIKFRRYAFNWLKSERGVEFEQYFAKCAPILNREDKKAQFDEMVQAEVKEYFKKILHSMKEYKHRF